MKKILYKLSVAVLLLASVFFCLVAYWLLRPYNLLEVELKILTPEVRAGEQMVYESHYCKYTDAPARFERQIINNHVIYYREITSNAPEGCDTVIIPLDIPSYASIGKYILKITATYQVNPLREIVVSYETEEFEIIAP